LSFVDGKFGHLTVIKEIRPDVFLCRCACGTSLELWRSQLACDVARHCGCRGVRRTSSGNRYHPGRHGNRHARHFTRRNGTKTKKYTWEYNSWNSMRMRCENPHNQAFDSYGGRGIKICKRWTLPWGEGFKNFLTDMGPRPQHKTLDRIDVCGHYEPTNCRWADAQTQTANRRNVIYPDGNEPPVESIKSMEQRVAEEVGEYVY
jgi:hypothetical protein